MTHTVPSRLFGFDVSSARPLSRVLVHKMKRWLWVGLMATRDRCTGAERCSPGRPLLERDTHWRIRVRRHRLRASAVDGGLRGGRGLRRQRPFHPT